MKKLQPIVIALFLCYFANTFAQTNYKIIEDQKIKNKVIVYAKLEIGNKQAKDAEIISKLLKKINETDADVTYQLMRKNKDDGEYTIQHFQQYYKGMKVVGATFAIHNKGDEIDFVNGNYADLRNVNLKPKLSEKEVITTAKVEADKKYKDINIQWILPEGLVICRDELSKEKDFKLAYQVHVKSERSDLDEVYYIAAENGNILNKEYSTCHANTTTAVGGTTYSGQQTYSNGYPIVSPNFVSDSYNGTYRLREVRQGVNIITLNNLDNPSEQTGSAVDITSATNTFSGYGPDAHFGAEKVFDYWKTVHNRNSIDNNGLQMLSYVRSKLLLFIFNNTPYYTNNFAEFRNDTKAVHYGNGDGVDYGYYAALDVAAHEWGHGINYYTAQLPSPSSYSEGGGLNEGFSDIWAAVIERWAFPNNQNGHVWQTIAGQVVLKAPWYLRNMSAPNSSSPNQPDTYNGTHWNSFGMDGHVSSGVLNFWFYLLSEGGSGTNDISNNYAVTGVGITKAAKIAYTTQRYLNSTADYAMARLMSIKAARDTFGCGSAEEIAVTNAWYAVGVGANYVAPSLTNVSGANSICACSTSANYTVTNNTDEIVTWTVNPQNILLLPQNPTGNSITITRNGCANGLVTLTATITLCGQPISTSKNINVGGPSFGTSTHAVPSDFECSETNYQCYTSGPNGTKQWFTATPLNHTSISWSKVWSIPSNGSGIIWSGNSAPNNSANAVNVYFRAANKQIVLKTTISNTCGSAEEYYCFSTNNTVCPPQGPSFTSSNCKNYNISVNPTSKQVQIKKNINECGVESADLQIKTIQIVDKVGNIIKEQNYQSDKSSVFELNLNEAKNDIYFVLIQYNDILETHQVAFFK